MSEPGDVIERMARAAFEVIPSISIADHTKETWADLSEAMRSIYRVRARACHPIAFNAGLERAAEIASAYAKRMEASAGKPHPMTGGNNIVAACKWDAGRTLEIAILAARVSHE